MIDRVANRIACQMTDEKIISPELTGLYAYRLVIAVETFLTTVTLLFLAVIVHRFELMAVLLISFALLRSKTGGYHFDSYFGCFTGSVLLFSIVTMLIPYIELNIYLMITVALAGIMVIYMGFINHPNLNLNRDGIRKKKKEARIVAVTELGIMLTLWIVGFPDKVFSCIALAVILDFLLMIFAKLKGQEVEPNGRKN